MSSHRSLVCAVALAAMTAATNVSAGALDSFEALSQEDFDTMVENLAAATHYRGVTPTEPLGIIGFDIGVGVGATSINERVLDLASEGDFDIGRILIPRVHAHKGLPFGVDVGGFISAVPETDIKLIGAEVRKALMEGSAITPAIGVRAGFSILQGLDQLDMNNLSVDISISKGFLFFTPYAGVGYVRSNGEASSEFNFEKSVANQQKVFAGVNVNFGLNFTLEVDRTGDYTSVNAKAGVRF